MFSGLYVYIVECSDGHFYTGITNHLEVRIHQHNSGLNPEAYTFSRRPVTLRWYEFFQNPYEAIDWEKRIKGWSRAKKQALIEGNFDLLPTLSKNARERAKESGKD